MNKVSKVCLAALVISITGCSTEEIKNAINEIIDERLPPIEEPSLEAFSILSVEPTSPRNDGLDLDFAWESASEELTGISYKVCLEDSGVSDMCHELGSVIDANGATITLDRIYPHSATNFFVIASHGDDAVVTANHPYTYELFKSQAIRTDNLNTSMSLGAVFAPRVGGENKAVYSMEAVDFYYSSVIEVSIEKEFDFNGDRVTQSLPNLSLAKLQSLSSEFSSSQGIGSIKRGYYDELIHVTTVRNRGLEPVAEAEGVVYFNGSDYELLPTGFGLHGTYGDQDELGYLFGIADNGKTQFGTFVGATFNELGTFSTQYSLVNIAKFANRDDHTQINADHLTLANGDKYMILRGRDDVVLVKLDASGAVVVDSVQSPHDNGGTAFSFDVVSQTLYAVSLVSKDNPPVGEYMLDLVVSAYKATPSGLDLISTYINEEVIDNLFPPMAQAIFVSKGGEHLIINLDNSSGWGAPTIQGYGQTIVLDMNSIGEFTGGVDFISSNVNPVPTDTVNKRSTSFLSKDMKSIQFHNGEAQYNIGKMTHKEL